MRTLQALSTALGVRPDRNEDRDIASIDRFVELGAEQHAGAVGIDVVDEVDHAALDRDGLPLPRRTPSFVSPDPTRRYVYDVPLDFDSSRRVAGMPALRRLVAAVEGANDGDEDEFLEWKSSLELGTTEAAYHVGRAILAFANRDPALASRRFEGCGYLIVGVEPGGHEGVTPIDPVQLAARVDKYVGGVEGPDWEARFVDHEDVQVLVVTIEPPRHGHPGYPLRKSNAVNEGTLFHRGKGKSAPANAAETQMLFERAQAAPSLSFEISCRLTPGDPLPKLNIANYVEKARSKAADRADELRQEAQPASQETHPEVTNGAIDAEMPESLKKLALTLSNLNPLGLPPPTPDDRTLDDYLAEVDDFEHRLIESSERSWGHAAWQVLDDVRLEVTNETDTYLTGLRVDVTFNDDRILCLDTEPEEEDQPTEPRRLGPRAKESPLFPTADFPLFLDPPFAVAPRTFTTSAEGNSVVFMVGKLPPRSTASSEELRVAVPTEVEGGAITATCTATAEGHHRIIHFALSAAVRTED